jgi:hypothetical protein
MAVGLLLTLRDGREHLFWADPVMKKQTARFDSMSLTAGVVINLLVAAVKNMSPLYRILAVGSGLVQLAQVAWLLYHPGSYMRHRVAATILQRLRSLAIVVIGTWGGQGGQATRAWLQTVHFERPVHAGTLGAFLTLACLVPM